MFTEKFYGNILKEVLYLDKNCDFIKKGLDEDRRSGIRYTISVTGLTELQLTLLNLRFGLSMSYTECGEVTGISASKARGLILNAIESIRMSQAYDYFTNGFAEGERMDHYIDSLFKRQQEISMEAGYEDCRKEIEMTETRHLARIGISEKGLQHLMKKGYHKVADILASIKNDEKKWLQEIKLSDEDRQILCQYTKGL